MTNSEPVAAQKKIIRSACIAYNSVLLNQPEDERNQPLAMEAAFRVFITAANDALNPLTSIKADDGDDFSQWDAEIIIRCEVTVGDIHKARSIAALGGDHA